MLSLLLVLFVSDLTSNLLPMLPFFRVLLKNFISGLIEKFVEYTTFAVFTAIGVLFTSRDFFLSLIVMSMLVCLSILCPLHPCAGTDLALLRWSGDR